MTFCDFELTLANISNTCRKFLKSIPYKQNSSEWLNIYTSVMLTFLNNVTMTNRQIDRLNHLESTVRLTDEHVVKAYSEESQQTPILFHLPDSMSDYILVLSRQLKKIISNDLTYILHTRVSENFNLLPLSVKEYIEDIEDENDEY